MAHIEINTKGSIGTIKVNGVQLEGVTGYHLQHTAGHPPRLLVEMAGDITLDGMDMLAPLPEPWHSSMENADQMTL